MIDLNKIEKTGYYRAGGEPGNVGEPSDKYFDAPVYAAGGKIQVATERRRSDPSFVNHWIRHKTHDGWGEWVNLHKKNAETRTRIIAEIVLIFGAGLLLAVFVGGWIYSIIQSEYFLGGW